MLVGVLEGLLVVLAAALLLRDVVPDLVLVKLLLLDWLTVTLDDGEYDPELLTDGDGCGLGLCDDEADRERLLVRDFDTDGVIVGVAAVDEDAEGQPNPLVHVGLEENDVPNDFVVV